MEKIKMGTTRKKIIISGLIICVIALFGIWHSKHARFTHGKMVKLMDKHIVKVLDRIKATPEQKQQITKISDQMKKEARAFRHQFMIQHSAIADALLSDEENSAKLHAELDKNFNFLRQFSHNVLDHLIRISKILSPEQRIDLKKKMTSAHGRPINE